MPVRLNSSGGGSVTLDVPATAGTFTVNLPAANGDVVVTGGSSTVQFGAGSVSAPSITFSGDTNTGIYSPAADTIAFTEGGVEAMRLDANGNVGIGTSSPSQRLDVAGNTTSNAYLLRTNASAPSGDASIYRPADNTLGFVTGNTERARITSGGDFQFNSGYGSVATAYGCRAWVNFNGTGTVAIRASGNVSSITDNGGGDYTVNFSTSMPDANYSICMNSLGTTVFANIFTLAAGSARISTSYPYDGVRYDVTMATVAVFR